MMFAPPGINAFQYPQQLPPMHSPGAKAKTDAPIPVSPNQLPIGSAKWQAVEPGPGSSVRAGDCRRMGELNLGRPPCTTFVMTPPITTVLGHRSTEQT